MAYSTTTREIVRYLEIGTYRTSDKDSRHAIHLGRNNILRIRDRIIVDMARSRVQAWG